MEKDHLLLLALMGLFPLSTSAFTLLPHVVVLLLLALCGGGGGGGSGWTWWMLHVVVAVACSGI